MAFTRYLLFIFFFSSASFYFSQSIALIHLKKEGSIIFFQKGVKSDSILQNKSDLFYFYIPDSLRKDLSLLSENGQFQKTKNDSIVKFVYLPGLKYESLFQQTEDKRGTEFKSLVNGACDPGKNKVKLQLFNRKENKVVLENNFTYKRN